MIHLVCHQCGQTNRIPEDKRTQDPKCGRCGSQILPDEPVNVSDTIFDKLVTRSEHPIVVDFWASWCGPCRMMAPVFAEAAKLMKGEALFVKVNTETSPHLATQYGIRSIPTLMIFQGGQVVAQQAGAMPLHQLMDWIRSHR